MKFSGKILSNCVFAFFVFGSLFTTFRVLLIGSSTSQSLGEYCISALPEIAVFFIAIYLLGVIKKNDLSIEFNYFDWIILSYIFSNILIGVFIAKDIKLSMYA